MSDVTMQIPRASLWNVLEVAMEYDLGSLPVQLQPRVLDIGANVGIFAIACVQQWRGARVMSFEPHPDTFAMLKHNVDGLPVEAHNQAVIGWQRDVVLHEGKHNRLCCSLFDIGDQDMSTAITVPTTLASELPPCDVLKIDTEGAELEILESYKHIGNIKVLLAELHGEDRKDNSRVMAFAQKAGLRAVDKRNDTVRFVR